jgi:formamidopyrimidine-DNA glycosylase
MPELPEVETIRRQLEPSFPAKIVSTKESDVVESILKSKNRDFDLLNLEIQAIGRKGKMLIFELSDQKKMLSHLGMSGSWRLSERPQGLKHTHLQLELESKGDHFFLSYIDPRRFGHLFLFENERAVSKLNELGIDISDTNNFNARYLYPLLKKYPNRKLKEFLLEQKFFAGVGNYIASEICARAGIRPTRPNGKISKVDCEHIILATQSVLEGQIKNKGLSFSGGYADTTGNAGEGVLDLVVFWQTRCGLCGEESVKKIILKGRGTFYCPNCQK